MRMVRQVTPLVSVVRSTEASASRRFLKYYFYGSFNPFLAACPFLGGCPLLGGSVMGGSTVYLKSRTIQYLYHTCPCATRFAIEL